MKIVIDSTKIIELVKAEITKMVPSFKDQELLVEVDTKGDLSMTISVLELEIDKPKIPTEPVKRAVKKPALAAKKEEEAVEKLQVEPTEEEEEQENKSEKEVEDEPTKDVEPVEKKTETTSKKSLFNKTNETKETTEESAESTVKRKPLFGDKMKG